MHLLLSTHLIYVFHTIFFRGAKVRMFCSPHWSSTIIGAYTRARAHTHTHAHMLTHTRTHTQARPVKFFIGSISSDATSTIIGCISKTQQIFCSVFHNLCSSNEDFGRQNRDLRVGFRSTFQVCEYSILANNHRKFVQKLVVTDSDVCN